MISINWCFVKLKVPSGNTILDLENPRVVVLIQGFVEYVEPFRCIDTKAVSNSSAVGEG